MRGNRRAEVTDSGKIPCEYRDDVVKLVVSRCTESESGGRMIGAILTNTMQPDISSEFRTRMMEGKAIIKTLVGVSDRSFTYTFDGYFAADGREKPRPPWPARVRDADRYLTTETVTS